MTSRARRWLLIAAVPVVLLVAGAVVLKVMFTGDRLRGLLIPRLEAATGRTVTVGDVSLALLPSLAIEVRDLAVSNRTGDGFSPGPMLALDALRIEVKLWPLLASRIEVTSVFLDRLRLLVESTGDGRSNYEDLGAGAGDAPPPQEQPPGAVALLLPDVRVRDAAVDYVNRAENSATRIRNLDLSLNIAGEGGSFTISGTASTDSLSYGTVGTPLLSGMRLSVAHRFRYDSSTDILRVEQGDVTVQNLRLSLTGTSAQNRTAPRLDFTLGSDSLNIADLLSLLPGGEASGTAGVRGEGRLAVRIGITGTITDSTEAEYRGTITADGARLQYAGLPKPVTDITIRSSFIRSREVGEFRIDELTARLGSAPLRLTMALTDFDDPSLALAASGSLDLGTIREYYPVDTAMSLAGALDLDVRIAGRIRDQSFLKASGALSFREVSVAGAAAATPLRGLNGRVKFTNDLIETPGLSLLIGRSDLSLTGRVRNYLSLVSADTAAPRSSAALTLTSRRLVMADIMTPDPPARNTDAAPPSEPRSAFILPAADVTVAASIDSLLLEKFNFTGVRGSLRISDDVVRMERLLLNGFGGTLVSTGSLNLADQARPLFDLTLDLTDLRAGALLTPFTSFGRMLSGSLSMKTSLRGALDDTLGLIASALQGNGSAALRAGSLTGFAVNEALAQQFNLPDLRTLPFRDWTNSFTIENGRLQIRDLAVSGQNAQYLLNGSHGLDGTLDYRLEILLPGSVQDRIAVPGFAAGAAELFRTPDGRLRFELGVSGTQARPVLQLRTDAARQKGEELARRKLDEEKKRLEEQLKRKGSDLLKNLFRKDSTP
jgi:uncharacterized protein involved in outer membrane biogenesis